MDFAAVILRLSRDLTANNIDFAFIGGFALQAAGVSRGTADIDFLVFAEKKDLVKELMERFGFRVLFESPEVLTFAGNTAELGRVDFFLAHRHYTLAMLKRAKTFPFLPGTPPLKVVCAEDLIGLKVQAAANDPSRRDHDMADIRSVLRVRKEPFDMEVVRDYFRVFEMEPVLDRMLEDEKNAPRP